MNTAMRLKNVALQARKEIEDKAAIAAAESKKLQDTYEKNIAMIIAGHFASNWLQEATEAAKNGQTEFCINLTKKECKKMLGCGIKEAIDYSNKNLGCFEVLIKNAESMGFVVNMEARTDVDIVDNKLYFLSFSGTFA